MVDAAAGPGSDFATISEGVAAAADGDVVLVRAGNYDGDSIAVLDGRSIAVVAEAGAKVTADRLRVQSLPRHVRS